MSGDVCLDDELATVPCDNCGAETYFIERGNGELICLHCVFGKMECA